MMTTPTRGLISTNAAPLFTRPPSLPLDELPLELDAPPLELPVGAVGVGVASGFEIQELAAEVAVEAALDGLELTVPLPAKLHA